MRKYQYKFSIDFTRDVEVPVLPRVSISDEYCSRLTLELLSILAA